MTAPTILDRAALAARLGVEPTTVTTCRGAGGGRPRKTTPADH
jgi:hypothetical protein